MVCGMLRIEHTEPSSSLASAAADDPRSASKRYADALWQAHPRTSPDWWREAHGHTVGKLALDWRDSLSAPQALQQGCNLVLASAQSWPQVHATLQAHPQPEACVSLLFQPDAALPAVLPNVLVWSPPSLPDTATRQATLTRLEDAVRQGHLEAYGVLFPASGSLPLHNWLEEAATAAQTVWSRKKRPALRWLALEQDLLNLDHLTAPGTRHRDEAVSTLELAARLGLAAVVLPQVLPAAAEPPPAALQALVALAQTEAALNEALGGWPHVDNKPLFSVLAALGKGYTPWPTPYVWQAWHAQVWPQVHRVWQGWQGSCGQLVQAYRHAWQGLLPHGASLAHAAAQPVLAQVLANLRPRVPKAWQHADDAVLLLTLLTALPAVTAVAVPCLPSLALLRDAPGLPDVAAVLAEGGEQR